MVRFPNRTYRPENRTNPVNLVLYKINLIRRLRIKSALRGGPRDLALQITVIRYYTISE